MEIGRSRVVSRDEFDRVLDWLRDCKVLSLDTETTGLRPYHGDKLFSLIIGTTPSHSWYFNFQPYSGLDPQFLLTPSHLTRLKDEVFSRPDVLWYTHRAKYDMAILAADGIELAGSVHCTMAQARVEYNEQFQFNLDAQLKKIGLAKNDTVEKYLIENNLFDWVMKRGKKTDVRDLHYDRAPWDLITAYGIDDGTHGFTLGVHQEAAIGKLKEASDQAWKEAPGDKPAQPPPTPWDVMLNERRLTKTVFRMEKAGVLVDLDYSAKAAEYELRLIDENKAKFREQTGRPFSDSPKLFAEVFAGEKERWVLTDKGNPSFDGDVLPTLHHPAAATILAIRKSKAKYDFYTGFAHHADAKGRVHSNFNQHGANHGRFSSSGPNFQNLSNEEDDAPKLEYIVRRAVVPPPGFLLCAIDYSTMEYRFMLEYACRFAGYITPLAKRILAGEDFHQATADLASQVTGRKVTRSQAKTTNFLNLYGGGTKKLAAQLKISFDEAQAIKNAINSAAPEIAALCRSIMRTAETRGYIRNWMGRYCYFSDPRYAYQAPNHLIAGGCADVMKLAMNRIDDLLLDYQSKMVLNVHDELVFYIAPGEEFLIAQCKTIMETAFGSKYLPLTCSAFVSKKSLADLEEWKEAA